MNLIVLFDSTTLFGLHLSQMATDRKDIIFDGVTVTIRLRDNRRQLILLSHRLAGTTIRLEGKGSQRCRWLDHIELMHGVHINVLEE